MAATAQLTVASLKMIVRDRSALAGTVAFPILFVVVFSLFDIGLAGEQMVIGSGVPLGSAAAGGGTVAYFDYVLPGLLAMGLMQFTMVGAAASVARHRELQVLRRLLATPLHPARFVAAQAAARLLLAGGQALLILLVGVALGAHVAGSWLLLLGMATLGNLVFVTLALAIAGRTSSVEGATNLAGLLTAPLMFLSGMFFPVTSMPEWAQGLAEVLPITPLIDAMRAVALDAAGVTDVVGDVLHLGVWAGLSALVAGLVFRLDG